MKSLRDLENFSRSMDCQRLGAMTSGMAKMLKTTWLSQHYIDLGELMLKAMLERNGSVTVTMDRHN